MLRILPGALLPPLIILFALLLRFESINTLWQKKENVLSCYDCFRYAMLTEQRMSGELTSINYLINVPDYTVNAGAEQLITYLGAFLGRFMDLKYVYVLVPPLLATFFVFPLYLWARQFSGLYSFLGASLSGTFNLIYWIRTSPGRYDTDFLILFFLFLLLWLITLLSRESRYDRAFILALLSGVSLNLFMWWYPKPIFIFLYSISLFLGSLIFKNNLRLTSFKVAVFLLSGGLDNFIYGVKQLWWYMESRVFYEPSTFVPFSMSRSVVELQPLDFGSLVKFTSDNYILSLLSFAGLILLFVRKWRYMLVTSPFILMGLSAFVAGNRMLIYLAPFLGLGIGFLLEEIYRFATDRLRSLKPALKLLLLLLVFVMSFPPYVFAFQRKQLFSDEFYNELSKLKTVTEPESFIWTWWDFGNVIQYAMKRGTFIDNGNWNIVKSYAVAYSFISSDQTRARNVIAYVSNNIGLAYKYSEKTYEDFLEDAKNYNRKLKNPVYILISPDLLSKPAIRELGSYGTHIKPAFKPIGSPVYYCEEVSGVIDCALAQINKKEMNLISIDAEVSKVYIYDRERKIFLKIFPVNSIFPSSLYIVYEKGKYYAVLIDKNMEYTNIVRWFIFKQHSTAFEPVYDNFPLITLYRVR